MSSDVNYSIINCGTYTSLHYVLFKGSIFWLMDKEITEILIDVSRVY